MKIASALCLAPYRLQGDAVGIAWPASPHRANIPEFTINGRHWFLPRLEACTEIGGARRVVRSPGVLRNPHRDRIAARAFGSRQNVPILFLRIEPIFAGLVFSKRHFAEKDKNDA